MAVGSYTSFTLFDEQFHGGFNETLVQNSDAFNAASGEAITMRPVSVRGHAEQETFMDVLSTMVAWRDTTSVAAATPSAMTTDDITRPITSRIIGPVQMTLDALKKAASNRAEFSFRVGEQAGKAFAVDAVNTALAVAQGAIVGAGAGDGLPLLDKSASASNTLDTDYLIDALALMGDAGDQVILWVMHSKAFYNLMKEQAAILVDSVAGTTINQGSVASLNRRVLVTDSSYLVNDDGITSGTPSYYTLGLTRNALNVDQNGGIELYSGVEPGGVNLQFIYQAEYDLVVGCKGYTYNDLASTKNPTLANLATAAKWTKQVVSIKSTAGVAIEHA